MPAGSRQDLLASDQNRTEGLGDAITQEGIKRALPGADDRHGQTGIQMIACQMSMEIMGVSASDLIDGISLGGVASYLEEAEQSNLNLFI